MKFDVNDNQLTIYITDQSEGKFPLCGEWLAVLTLTGRRKDKTSGAWILPYRLDTADLLLSRGGIFAEVSILVREKEEQLYDNRPKMLIIPAYLRNPDRDIWNALIQKETEYEKPQICPSKNAQA